MTLIERLETLDAPDRVPVCSDYDNDCAKVPSKINCFLYDPAKGRCPYLSKAKETDHG